jgi:iron(III) transport system permease protein
MKIQSNSGSMTMLFNNFHKLRKFIFVIPGFLILFTIVAYPLATIILQSLFPKVFDMKPSFEPSFAVIRDVFSSSYTYKAIKNSLTIGFLAALISTVIGAGLAVVVKRCHFRFSKAVELLAWLVFLTPSYLISQGWILLLQRNGILSQLFTLPNLAFDWFFSPITLIVIMGFKHFPLVYISVSNALTSLGSEFEDAARLNGARPWIAWFRINLPLLAPAMLAGAAIVFADGIGDFGLSASFVRTTHLPIITYSIFAALNQSPVNYPRAGALSFILILLVAIAVILQFWFLRKGSYSVVKNQVRPFRKIKTGLHAIWLYPLVGSILAAAYLIPIATTLLISFMKTIGKGISSGNFTFAHYINAFSTSGASFHAIILSLQLALGAAVAAVLLGLGFAYVIEYTQVTGRKVLYLMTMSTIAIPGIVLAAGFVFAFNATWLVPLHLAIYGTMACLYLAYLAGVLPYSVRLHVAALTQISPILITAGRVQGASAVTLFRRIVFPLVAGTSLSIFFLSFSHTFFELPASQLLYPAGSPPFPIVLDSFYNQLEWENGAALTVLAILGSITLFIMGQIVSKRLLSVSYYSDSDRPDKKLNQSFKKPKIGEDSRLSKNEVIN